MDFHLLRVLISISNRSNFCYSCIYLLFNMLLLLIFPVGDTPLAYAVRSGTLDTVQYLLHHDANPDKPNGKGSTPLHLAAAGGLSLCKLSFSSTCAWHSLKLLCLCVHHLIRYRYQEMAHIFVSCLWIVISCYSASFIKM